MSFIALEFCASTSKSYRKNWISGTERIPIIFTVSILIDYIWMVDSYSFLSVKENFLENMATGGGAIYFLIRDVSK